MIAIKNDDNGDRDDYADYDDEGGNDHGYRREDNRRQIPLISVPDFLRSSSASSRSLTSAFSEQKKRWKNQF